MNNTSPALGAQSGSRRALNSQLQEKEILGTLLMAGVSSGAPPVCQAPRPPDYTEIPEPSQSQVRGLLFSR